LQFGVSLLIWLLLREIEMSELKFHFVKGPDYRDVPVHGALCGINPQGEGLFLVFYSERTSIPTHVTHELTEFGALGPEIDREAKEGVIRTMHVCGYMSVDQARALRSLLDQKITEFDALSGVTKQ
jgi:hypothetical protein